MALLAIGGCGARSELRPIPACNDLEPGPPAVVAHTAYPLPAVHGGLWADGRYRVAIAVENVTTLLAATLVVRDGTLEIARMRDGGPVVRGTYLMTPDGGRIAFTPTCGAGLPPFVWYDVRPTGIALVTGDDAGGADAIWIVAPE